ncbi:hypothetical protein D3C78_1720490 [compost metagenome]
MDAPAGQLQGSLPQLLGPFLLGQITLDDAALAVDPLQQGLRALDIAAVMNHRPSAFGRQPFDDGCADAAGAAGD